METHKKYIKSTLGGWKGRLRVFGGGETPEFIHQAKQQLGWGKGEENGENGMGLDKAVPDRGTALEKPEG